MYLVHHLNIKHKQDAINYNQNLAIMSVDRSLNMACLKTFPIVDAKCPFHVSMPNEMNRLKQPWNRKLSRNVITVKFGPRT